MNISPKLRKFSFFETVGYSYGLGIGVIVLTLFSYSIIGIPWSKFYILLPLIVLWIASYRNSSFLKYWNWKKLYCNKVTFLMFILLIITILYVLLEAMLRPVSAWDAWSHWYMSGKAFYIDGFVNNEVYKYGHFENPPIVTLLISYSYIILGKENDTLSLFNFFLFYVNVVLLFFFQLKKYSNTFYSFLFTFLLATLPVLIRHAGRYDIGYADLPLSYFFFCSILLFHKFIQDKNLMYLLIMEFFVGMGVVVKNEGVPFLFIMQIILLIRLFFMRNISKKIISFYLSGFISLLGWIIYKTYYNIPPIYFFSGHFHIDRLLTIFRELIYEFANIQRWNLLWPVFFITFFYSIYKKNFKYAYILFPVLLQLLVYILIWTITPVDYIVQIHGTIDRLLLHLVPIIMFWVGIKSYQILFK